jgi:hypothetical protein
MKSKSLTYSSFSSPPSISLSFYFSLFAFLCRAQKKLFFRVFPFLSVTSLQRERPFLFFFFLPNLDWTHHGPNTNKIPSHSPHPLHIHLILPCLWTLTFLEEQNAAQIDKSLEHKVVDISESLLCLSRRPLFAPLLSDHLSSSTSLSRWSFITLRPNTSLLIDLLAICFP